MRGQVPVAFCAWQAPSQLFSLAEAEAETTGVDHFLTANKSKHVREAWIIGRAGTLLDASKARLANADPPDGYLEFQKFGVVPVEVAELLQKGRRRGDENHVGVRHQEHEELTAAIEHNVAWLTELIRAKLAKDQRCPRGTVLLIYHKSSLYNFDPTRTRTELETVSTLSGNNIVGSLILYEGEIYGRDTLSRATAHLS